MPFKWDRAAKAAGERRRVFCASLADVFEDRPELVEPRVRLFHLISGTRHLDWLLLTKRPENIRRFHGGNGVPRSWPENMPPNVWLGVSVEDQQRADERIPILIQTPAAVRFLSCEPLLGPVDLKSWLKPCTTHFSFGPLYNHITDECPFPALQWIICGGESGRGARPCHLAWLRGIVSQCQAAGVPVFVKQLGACASDAENGIAGASLHVTEEAAPLVSRRLRDPKGGDPEEWKEDLRVREFPR